MKKIAFPVTVNDISTNGKIDFTKPTFHDIGVWVAVRPCDAIYLDKTYLGILLGDLPTGFAVEYDAAAGTMNVLASNYNPAIYVPDLKKVIRGFESWWREITTPEQLKQITDADIHSTWYVRALHDMLDKAVLGKEDSIAENTTSSSG